jgi:hypothetical protein
MEFYPPLRDQQQFQMNVKMECGNPTDDRTNLTLWVLLGLGIVILIGIAMWGLYYCGFFTRCNRFCCYPASRGAEPVSDVALSSRYRSNRHVKRQTERVETKNSVSGKKVTMAKDPYAVIYPKPPQYHK